MSNEPVAITLTGGIDSTVLAYKLCDEYNAQLAEHYTRNAPDATQIQRRSVLFVYADMSINGKSFRQANHSISLELCVLHARKLASAYVKYLDINFKVIPVVLPAWSATGVFESGFMPSENSFLQFDQLSSAEYGQKSHIDGRNTILFMHLMSFCAFQDIPRLITGHQLDAHEWSQLDSLKMRSDDVGPAFIDRINLMGEVGFSKRVRVEAPFINARMSKADIVREGWYRGINFDETYSCYYAPPCGRCQNCCIRTELLGKC